MYAYNIYILFNVKYYLVIINIFVAVLHTYKCDNIFVAQIFVEANKILNR